MEKGAGPGGEPAGVCPVGHSLRLFGHRAARVVHERAMATRAGLSANGQSFAARLEEPPPPLVRWSGRMATPARGSAYSTARTAGEKGLGETPQRRPGGAPAHRPGVPPAGDGTP
ncbi:hypothetical protein Sdagh_51400 [Streptomyces daghestanicus]|uniref:Uncharacterized protein n=1 Tax=Streptomyces daghestanicus TaxID=66885 RepID=A0ABQ3Q831_9ACTN|nr:hypothetical protein Sdagh_51400 [Streptomyces daghestanicus]